MGKKKAKKKKPNYNAQNRPVGGNNLGCTQQPPPKKPGVTCQFSKIELTVAKTPKAGDTKVLSVPASATNGNSRSIEVISGDKSNKSDADLKIVGAQKTNCTDDDHKKSTVIYGGFTGETGLISEDAQVSIPVYYPYPSVIERIRGLTATWAPKKIHIVHVNCKNGKQEILLVVFPDRKITLELELSFSWADLLEKPAWKPEEASFSAKFEYEKNGGDTVEITLEVGRELDEDDEPSLEKEISCEVKVNGWAVGGGFPHGSDIAWPQLKNDILGVGDLVVNLWDLIRRLYDNAGTFIRGAKKLIRAPQPVHGFELTIEVGGGIEWTSNFEHDDKDKVVDVDEFTLSAITFKPELKWQFGDVLLSMIPWVGRILAYLNNYAKKNELGGLEIWFAVSGEVKGGVAGRRTKRSGRPAEWSSSGKLDCSINLELGASGKIRVDLVTRYETYEAGAKATSGATFEFHRDKKTDFYNNALEIELVITRTIEYANSSAPPPASKVPDEAKGPESSAYVNKTFTVIEEKQLWGDD